MEWVGHVRRKVGTRNICNILIWKTEEAICEIRVSMAYNIKSNIKYLKK
jgi:hypothetical protein